MSAPGIDGYHVKVPNLKHGPGIGRAAGSDIAPFGVADDDGQGRVPADVLHGSFQGLQSGYPQRLVEGQVGLVGAYQAGGGIDDSSIEVQGVGDRHSLRVNVQADA